MIKIITDSGSEISEEISQKYNIDVLPILVNDGEKEYGLGELTSEEMFKNMRNKVIYKTSQVSYGEYVNCFRKYAEDETEIIYIGLSSGITATMTQANNAKEEVLKDFPNAKIHLVDSKCATMGLYLLVIRAAMMAKAGKDSDYILDTIEKMKVKQEQIFSVTSLEFLLRGGRISSASAAIGGLLNIKPILEVTHSEGKLESIDKARGEKALIKKMISIMKDRDFDKEQTIIVCGGDSLTLPKEMGEKIVEEFGVDPKNIEYKNLGVVVGAHTGPDFMAVFFISGKSDEEKEWLLIK